MTALLSRLRNLLGRARFEADLREEMETHRTLRQDALEREGLSPDAARAASRRALGNVGLAIEDSRDVWALRIFDAVRQDVRTASRALRKSPAFTVVAIGTLALGIGANTALFSIFSSLLLRPLPVRAPERLVLLRDGSWTYPIWQELQRLDGDLVEGLAAWADERFDLSQGGETAFVEGAFVNGRYFDVLGVQPARGRLLLPADDVEHAPSGPVAVISHALWLDRYGGTDDVLGRQILLDRVPFTIVGVMPRQFLGVEVGRRADVVIPFGTEPLLRRADSALRERSTWWVEVLMRMKPGQNMEQVSAALRAVQPRIRLATMPDWPQGMRDRYLADPFTVVPASTGRSSLRSRFETPLAAMVVGVGLALLVACANIASLLLARALSRQRELSVRIALGAARWHVARLLLTESFLVAAAGAALGLCLARWCSALLVAQLSTLDDMVVLDLAIDWRVVAFTIGLAGAATLVAGVAPVLGVRDLAAEGIRDGGRGVAGDARFAIRGALVVAQIAVSLLLVIAAGLFLGTFSSLARVPLGFTTESRLVLEVNLQRSAVSATDRLALVQRLLDGAAATPGVTSAAIAAKTPGTSAGRNNWVGTSPSPPADRSLMTWIHVTTPGWFETMGIQRLAGRDFEATDVAGAPPVAIVNETFAARFLEKGSPIGQVVPLGAPGGGRPYQVVGLVRDALYRSPREGRVPIIHLPLAQETQVPSTLSLTVTTAAGGRSAIEQALAAALTGTDPAVAVTFRTFDQLLDATLTRERIVAWMAAFFGGLALLLAAIGVYGIVTHGVRARQAEIGVRVALGASPLRIVRLVLQSVSVLIAVGIGLGVVAAFWTAPLVDALLFGLQARDATTFAGAAATLAIVGLVAAWVPARRAALLEPARVLREG